MRKPRHERLAEAANGLLLPAVVTNATSTPPTVTIHGSETAVNATLLTPGLMLANGSLVWVTRAGSKTIVMGLRENTANSSYYGAGDTGPNYVGGTGMPGYQGGWVSYGAQYAGAWFQRWWNGHSWVGQIGGLVKGGSTGTANPIFTLPAGYRPRFETIFAQLADTYYLARVDIATNGEVYVTGYQTGGSNGFVSLDGINYAIWD